MKFYLGLNGEPITSRVSDLFSGVGLIRGEYLCRRERAYTTIDRCQRAIEQYCRQIAALFAPDPVWYRFVDMETSEVNLLRGVDYRVDEKTTMLGLRGVRRAIAYPDAFELEASAVTIAARAAPNLHVVLPFVHDVREVDLVNHSLARLGFPNRVGMMAEIPSAILNLSDYFACGVSSITIGLNDLASLTLGAHRQATIHNLVHPSVLKLVGMALETSAAKGVTAMVAGYFTSEILTTLESVGCEHLILHYSSLPRFLGYQFSSLPHVLDLSGIKADVRRRVAMSLAAASSQGAERSEPHGATPASSDQNVAYLRALAAALAGEMRRAEERCPPVLELDGQRRELDAKVESLGADASHGKWVTALAHYRELGFALAARLNEFSEVSRTYASMNEFWSDVRAQSLGASPYTFWDTYEHGRRRQLERLMAGVYGAEDSLLLNSGMSGIAAAIEAAELGPGDRVLTGLENYFETSEYLEQHLSRRGIELIRAPISQAGAVGDAILQARPKLVLFETATNSPSTDVPIGLSTWMSIAPETLFVCDNTVQGTLTRWFVEPELMAILPERFLVVESATKYVSQAVMAGIVYGRRPLVERARAFARVTGQQLQEKAFNYLREGDVLHVRQRLELHSRNAKVFAEAIAGVRQSRFSVRLLSSGQRERVDDLDLFGAGVGGMIFLVPGNLPGAEEEARQLCRQVLSTWQERLAVVGYSLPVRAGFGWNETTARIYESGMLNQRSAPAYLRISVGIEPIRVARHYGSALRSALEDVS